jgi:apoptosis-inducing factor 3
MAHEQSPPSGPDLTRGVTRAEFLDGKLAGYVGDQEVLLVDNGTEIFAVAARCAAFSSVPPFFRYAVIPVARKL